MDNYMISECKKIAQKDRQTKQDSMGKVMHREFYKWLKFDHPNKLYMYKSYSSFHNEPNEILWEFEIHTHIRKSDLMLIKKKTEFAVPWNLTFHRTSEWN